MDVLGDDKEVADAVRVFILNLQMSNLIGGEYGGGG